MPARVRSETCQRIVACESHRNQATPEPAAFRLGGQHDGGLGRDAHARPVPASHPRMGLRRNTEGRRVAGHMLRRMALKRRAPKRAPDGVVPGRAVSHTGVAATFGLTSSMQAIETAMKTALKIQIEVGPVRSINWPPMIGPVIAAAEEAK